MGVLGKTLLAQARDLSVRLAFYEWAYGALAEPDQDIGILGEFMAGLYVGGLAAKRREKAPCDLVADDGRTVEVKTSVGGEKPHTGTKPLLRWTLRAERAALRGERPVSDVWLFLHVRFPEGAGSLYDVFDPAPWQVWVVPGEEVRRLNRGSNLSSVTLEKAGYRPHPLTDLPRLVCPSASETSRLARENTRESLLLLRLAFFTWAYGDLTEGFNAGRFAEFQVLRLLGRRPFGRRCAKGPVDLVTRHGHAVEVKHSRKFARSAKGDWHCDFCIPVYNGVRAVDHFVFCQLAEPGLDPVPLANLRFRWVPTEAIADFHMLIRNTTLDRLGFPPLTAAQLVAAEAGT